MNSELNKILGKSLRKPTFIDKIKYKIKLIKLTNFEVDSMRKIIIKEAKPLFEDFYLNRKNKTIIEELTVKFLDKRIMSLPKENILELYTELNDLKRSKSKDAKTYLDMQFIWRLSLLYSLNGWFRKELVSI